MYKDFIKIFDCLVTQSISPNVRWLIQNEKKSSEMTLLKKVFIG